MRKDKLTGSNFNSFTGELRCFPPPYKIFCKFSGARRVQLPERSLGRRSVAARSPLGRSAQRKDPQPREDPDFSSKRLRRTADEAGSSSSARVWAVTWLTRSRRRKTKRSHSGLIVRHRPINTPVASNHKPRGYDATTFGNKWHPRWRHFSVYLFPHHAIIRVMRWRQTHKPSQQLYLRGAAVWRALTLTRFSWTAL